MQEDINLSNLLKMSNRMKRWGILLIIMGSIAIFACFVATIVFMVYQAYHVQIKSIWPIILFIVCLMASTSMFTGGIYILKYSRHIMHHLKGDDCEK